MIISEPNAKFAIRELRREDTKEGSAFTWRYKSGSHFLIIVSDAAKQYTLENVQDFLSQEYKNDEEFLYNPAYRIYKGKENLNIYLIREEVFQKAGMRWELVNQDLEAAMPYSVSVYVCDVDDENPDEEELIVYSVNEEGAENTLKIPLKIFCVTEVIKKGLFSKQYYASIRIMQKPANYKDGDLVYRIRGWNIEVPIAEKALRRELFVTLNDDNKPVIDTSEAAKDLYVIIEEGRQ